MRRRAVSGAATALGAMGVAMCFGGLAMAVTSWVLAICVGGAFLVLAAAATLFAYARSPKEPIARRAPLADGHGAERLA